MGRVEQFFFFLPNQNGQKNKTNEDNTSKDSLGIYIACKFLTKEKQPISLDSMDKQSLPKQDFTYKKSEHEERWPNFVLFFFFLRCVVILDFI